MKKNKPKNNTIKSEETTIEPPVYAVMKVAVFPRGTGLYSEYLTEVEFVDGGAKSILTHSNLLNNMKVKTHKILAESVREYTTVVVYQSGYLFFYGTKNGGSRGAYQPKNPSDDWSFWRTTAPMKSMNAAPWYIALWKQKSHSW